MTREKAIEVLKNSTMKDTLSKQWKEAYKMAIKALEQESILDKIITEIEALNPVDYVSMSSYEGHRGARYMQDDVLQIIDKYKAERSDKE